MFNGIYRRATSSLIIALFVLFALFAGTPGALAQGTIFTYQGKLTESGGAANGSYDLQFKLLADTAVDAAQLGGMPPSGFIQNTTSSQASANFNIAGNGTVGGLLSANVVSAATQYNIGNNRVLMATVGNIFLGISAGQQISISLVRRVPRHEECLRRGGSA